jgi:hypothetical protein
MCIVIGLNGSYILAQLGRGQQCFLFEYAHWLMQGLESKLDQCIYFLF